MQFSAKNQKLLITAAFLITPFITTHALAVDLVGVHDLAVKNDPRLQAALYRKEATAENKTQAWSNLLPSLSGYGSIGRGTSDIEADNSSISNNDIDSERYGVDLRQSLYDQANYEQLDVARGQISQADAVYNQAYQDFLVRVADSYFRVLTASDGVIFAEAEEKALQRQYEQAEQRFEVGLTAVTDVHEARASYDNARARAIVQRNVLADTQEGLYELTGEYFEKVEPLREVLPLVAPIPESAAEWVDIAMEYNPTIVAAVAQVEVADSTVRLQKAGHYPTLDLVGNYNRFTNNNYIIRDDFQNAIGTTSLIATDTTYGIQLQVPIYQGGVVSSRTRQARSLLNAVNEDLDQSQRAVARQTNNAYRGVIAGIEQVGAFEQAMVSAESALEATQAGFEVGTRTIVDVLIAQQRYFQAQRDNSLARHTYIVDHLRLKAAAGVLQVEDLKKVNEILE
jgi:outer membrane protein